MTGLASSKPIASSNCRCVLSGMRSPLRVPSVFWGMEEASTNVELKAADNDLLEYERVLLEGLFGSRGGSVQLSNLEKQFYDRSELVCSSLYKDAVQRGWFIEQPDKVHQRWVVRGRAVTVAGASGFAAVCWRHSSSICGFT